MMIDTNTWIWSKLPQFFIILATIFHLGCVEKDNYEKPELCENEWKPNISIVELQSLYRGETIQIKDDWVLKAYIISSDREANFFGSLHIQDDPHNPNSGFEVLVDFPDTHIFYPKGSVILMSLKGMYMGKSRGNFQLGGIYSFFQQQNVGRLPGNLIDKHLRMSCDKSIMVRPKSISLNSLDNEKPSTYVEIDSLQFAEVLIGQPYADTEKETTRELEDCYGNTIRLLNSGYANFSASILPSGGGKITGVLSKDGDDLVILINELSDVRFVNERCPSGPAPVSSDNLLISEIADPDNNNEARFIELYNSGDEDLPLLGWKLERYTNDNLQLGSEIDLSELSIPARGTITIASNANVFEEVFGFPAHLEGGKNSAADSNGDDNLVLRDPFGEVKDIFGRIGEDGSNTDHEFEDGKAQRRTGINQGNASYDPTEWILYNDTGFAGTLNLPQLAPENFSPGKR